MSMKMKQQDQYHFDPILTAPKIIFQQVGCNQFFVNSRCIVSNKKITVGEAYLLIDSTKDIGSKIRIVVLIDLYFRRGILHLIVRDIKSQKVFTLDHDIQFPENECPWQLIGINYLIDQMNIKAVHTYCGCGNDSKKKSNTENKHILNNDDFLEFDF